MGEFVETVKPGAFARSLKSPDGIYALYDHERRSVLGRVGAGTLKLAEDAKGLAFDLQLPDTGAGRDLAVLVQRGDVSGCSFAFKVHAQGDKWEQRSGRLHRDLLSVDLKEITITPQPAYANTSVAKRSMPRSIAALSLRALWLETVR